jgi:hypothetical protein
MVRALVQKLPVMVTPRWVRVLTQPIAIEDALAYLIGALEIDVRESVVYEIGGADRISYEGIMLEYARQRGLKRLIIPVPVLALVTPLYFRIGRWLIESVRNPTVVNDAAALRDFPVRPMGIRLAIERALKNEDKELAETRWSDALPSGSLEHRWGGVRFGSRLLDSREMRVLIAVPELFRPIRCIGGEHGWYSCNWLWNRRGFIDKILGGVGAKRRPRDPHCVLPGDTVGFWRVEAMEPNRCLRLYAEMKLPGRAWLQFEVGPDEGGSVLRQTAIFDPVGLGGLLYWYALYPLHMQIFRRMICAIIRAACLKPRLPAT